MMMALFCLNGKDEDTFCLDDNDSFLFRWRLLHISLDDDNDNNDNNYDIDDIFRFRLG